MASGWTNDDAVNEQIDATVADGLRRVQARLAAAGQGASHCDECEVEIPAARRALIPNARLCVRCQEEADRSEAVYSGYNRRGSKDSQLR